MASSRLTIPPELKRITQYVRRAEELDHDNRPQSRIVAYYCRQYAVQTGIQLSNSPASRTCLSQLLSSLETEKKAMSVFSPEECATICTNFATEIFDKADRDDRAGAATKGTAKTFYAAAVFLKIIEQFHDNDTNPMDEDINEKWKYARWKAMDINKAISEGREVVPGGYGEMEAFQDVVQQTDTTSPETNDKSNNPPEIMEVHEYNNNDNGKLVDESDTKDEGTEVDLVLGPPPSVPTGLPITDLDNASPPVVVPLPPPAPVVEDTPLSPPSPPPSPPKAVSPPKSPTKQSSSIFSASTIKKTLSPTKNNDSNNNNTTTSQEALADALELTRFALAALEAKDSNLGRNRLEEALKCLKRISTKGDSPTKSFFKNSFKKIPIKTPQKDNGVGENDHNVLFMTKSAISALEKHDASIGKDRIKKALNCMNYDFRMNMEY